MALPTDIANGRDNHAHLHNETNAEVNRVADLVALATGAENVPEIVDPLIADQFAARADVDYVSLGAFASALLAKANKATVDAISAEMATGRLSAAGLEAEYATRGLPALAGFKRALEAATTSVGFQVLGDSTGNESTEWPRLFLADLMAAHPALTFRELVWSDATQAFTRTTLQTGAAGALYQDCDGVKADRVVTSTSLTGTIDVRAHVRAPDYTPTSARMVVGAMSFGKRSWSLCLNTSGALVVMYSTDASAVATMTSTANLAVADNADVWLRAVFTPNDGAGNRVAKFYTSTDGVTWTQLGATVTTAGAVTLYDVGSTDYFRLGGTPTGSYGYWTGRIYEVQICDGEGGPTVAPCLPDQYAGSTSAAPVVGAKVVTLVNGSHAGADLAYLNNATRLPKMTPHYGQMFTFLSCSHNDAQNTGPAYVAAYHAWRLAVQARIAAPVVVLTQNPQKAAQTNAVAHGMRRLNLLAYAAAHNLGVIDIFRVFTAHATWEADWMTDNVHPDIDGQTAWKNAIRAEYDPL